VDATNPDNAKTAERRAHSRQSVAWTGRIMVKNAASVSCAVLNVSERGAKLRLRQPVALPAYFTLSIDNFGEAPVTLLGVDDGVVARVGFLDDPQEVRRFFRHALAAFRPESK